MSATATRIDFRSSRGPEGVRRPHEPESSTPNVAARFRGAGARYQTWTLGDVLRLPYVLLRSPYTYSLAFLYIERAISRVVGGDRSRANGDSGRGGRET
jgi:hypothetical protein